jgi:hypothetical protein
MPEEHFFPFTTTIREKDAVNLPVGKKYKITVISGSARVRVEEVESGLESVPVTGTAIEPK